jgi:hypothetical protein
MRAEASRAAMEAPLEADEAPGHPGTPQMNPMSMYSWRMHLPPIPNRVCSVSAFAFQGREIVARTAEPG